MARQDVLTEDDDDRSAVNQGQETGKEEVEVLEAPPPEVNQEDEQDERLDVTGAAQEEAEEHHERKKETAKERRERAKLARDRDRKEIEFQRNVIAQLDKRINDLQAFSMGTEARQLQQQLEAVRKEAAQFRDVALRAQQAGNVPDAFQARDLTAQAEAQAIQLENQLKAVVNAAQAPKQPQVPAFVPYAKSFAEKKPWYDPSGRDEDSAVVLAIDSVLSKEGRNPNTPDYWEELERRVKSRLPHRYKNESRQDPDDDYVDQDPEPKTRRGPPVGGARSGATPGKVQIRLSPERVQAMKDANAWDDPVLRARLAKQYAEFDRRNKTSASR